MGSKHGLELSQVKLYRHYLRGNKNFFELAGGSSYRGFMLLRVLKIDLFMVYDAILAGGANMAKITVNVWDFGPLGTAKKLLERGWFPTFATT